MPRRNKLRFKYLEPRQSPRFPHPEADYSLLDKEEEQVPEEQPPPAKRKRGRPPKKAQPPVTTAVSTADPAPPPLSRTDIILFCEQLSFELHLADSLDPPSIPPPDSYGRHISVLSETDPDLWDTVFPSYTKLPSYWHSNKVPRRGRKASKLKDLQLEYLTDNFILPLYRKSSDFPRISRGSEDSKTNEPPVGEEKKPPMDLLEILAIAEAKIREMAAAEVGKEEASEAVKVAEEGDWVLPKEEPPMVKKELEKPPESPLCDVSLPSTPVEKEKKEKQIQRSLCFYCEQMVVIADLTMLPIDSASLEAAMLTLANGDEAVAGRMKEDGHRHGNYKICRKHATLASGRSRMTRNKGFIHDDEAIARWKRRIDDDAHGRMMTFEDATEEFNKTPMASRRCFYCSRPSRHTVSVVSSSKDSDQRENLIKALALGSGDVEAILRHILSEDPLKSRNICAAHFRRSSFIACPARQIRLRKNEVPIGDELVNKVLCFTYQHVLLNDKETRTSPVFSKVKVDEWDRNELGEKVDVSCQKVDLTQTLPTGTDVLHRFCSSGSCQFVCLACSVVHRDFIGIMDIRTPGLLPTSRKEKRPASSFLLWIGDNREELRTKIEITKGQRDYMSKAKLLWEATSPETKEVYEKKRMELMEQFWQKENELIKASKFMSLMKPAAINLIGDEVVDAQGLEHICLEHGVPFKEDFLTDTGYFPPRLVVPGYEKEVMIYYAAMEKRWMDLVMPQRKRKRTGEPLTAENYELLQQRLECSVVPTISKEKWTALFWNDHDYLHPNQMEALGWKKPQGFGDPRDQQPQQPVLPDLPSATMHLLSGMTGSLTPGASITFKTQTNSRIYSKAFEKIFDHGFDSPVKESSPTGVAGSVTKLTPFSFSDANGFYASADYDKMKSPFGQGFPGPLADASGAPQEVNSPLAIQKLLNGVSTMPIKEPTRPRILLNSTVSKAKIVEGKVETPQLPEASQEENRRPASSTEGAPLITDSPVIPQAFSCPFSIDSILSKTPHFNQPRTNPFSLTPSRLLPISAVRRMKHESPRPLLEPSAASRTSRYFKAMYARVEPSSNDPSPSTTSLRGAHVSCQKKYTFKPKILCPAVLEKKPSSLPPPSENDEDSTL